MQRTYGTSTSVAYRSPVTDVFDGRILSSVNCRTCHHTSNTFETFQDLSLAIPTAQQFESMQQFDSGACAACRLQNTRSQI